MFSWGIFFENGMKAVLELDFGPDSTKGENTTLTSLQDPWMLQLAAYAPLLYQDLSTGGAVSGIELQFAFVVVNPPVLVPDDYEFFRSK